MAKKKGKKIEEPKVVINDVDPEPDEDLEGVEGEPLRAAWEEDEIAPPVKEIEAPVERILLGMHPITKKPVYS